MSFLPFEWSAETVLCLWIGFWSAVAVFLTVSDKLRAKRNVRRIRERTLFLFSALGGSAAMLLTMLFIRHKTRHSKFMLGIPLIMVLQAVLIAWILRRF
ncbi:MAG: DUF1294 domain-containing protein [Ruminococcaceae bacterium]|jgi:uncharacterized membrane protein YsdA (DUF1294 family)|nr:DUF1294 domain-containing protein [Oscillospiraceae bacterium]